jgi:hypothetical protein
MFVTVRPHPGYGAAAIWDADILIWAASVISDPRNRGANDIRALRGKKDAHFGGISERTDEVDRETEDSRGMSLSLSDWFCEAIV